MQSIVSCREDFPILRRQIYGKPLIYLDNAATMQMPVPVLDCIREHYTYHNGNVHRGIHLLSEESTASLEKAREIVCRFLNADEAAQIVFTQGCTDSINLVAHGLAPQIQRGDEIIVSALEHHSNFVPWQQLCREKGAKLRIIPVSNGIPNMAAYYGLLNKRTRIVAVTHISNLTGTVFPIAEIIAAAKTAGAYTLIDGAQSVRHGIVQAIQSGCDFCCFSGHKVMAPTGIGVLYGRREALEQLAPSRLGGGMVDQVEDLSTSYGPLPSRLEAGTPNYVGAIALGAALQYLESLGLESVEAQEDLLLKTLETQLSASGNIHILGTPAHRAGALSFTVEGIHPYDLASLLDKEGIAVRSGSHCAQPGLRTFGISGALRVSPAFYNTVEEITRFCTALHRCIGLLQKWSANDHS